MTTIISDEAVNIALNTWLGGVPAWRNNATERLRTEMRAALTSALPFLPVQGVKVKALGEDDYEVIIDAAAKAMRKATSGVRGQTITVHDCLDWWVMKATENHILSALEPSAAREQALEEGYRQGIEAAAQKAAEMLVFADTTSTADREIPAAIRALSSPDHIADAGKVEGDGWMPIESAPKDGTVIDLWSDEYGRLTDCYWGAPMAYEGGETGWVNAHSNEWAESPDEFIHWRPLPLPPVKGGQNG
ncbi:hypothetical protein R5W60_05345 [Brucella pseudintermedia]|uniref:hypothetical protein n=1 Tax=Brucella pseudintermedia TaxID=370111 RepID=UPI00366E5E9F|nr:hypothetical protein R5W60_04020 [Brucella pseudintermedia]WPM81122.1 hypothetical protein R5W60_05345 [Brucella pseudintermedia]